MSATLNNSIIAEKLKKLPDEPGVYIYSDANGTVIYVGKARILKNRVRSYFHSNELNAKTRRLVSNIADLNYIVTSNELEALLLENNLIKKYKPKYNILLKDDKGYPYLRIDPREDYPKLELARKIAFDGALYFGPYHGAGSAHAISDIAYELYPLRTCNYDFSKSKSIRPCLKYHIGRCPAPCNAPCKKQYKENVNGVIDFLKGNQNEALDIIRKKMEEASDRLEFELAAELRDKLKKANEILSKQKIVLDKNRNIDVISALIRDTFAVICSLYVRSGRLIGVNTEELPGILCDTPAQLLSTFIMQNYTDGAFIPSEIICDAEPEDKDILEEVISGIAKHKVSISVPMRGKRHELCLMAKRNARERMEKSNLSLSYRDDRIIIGLDSLKRVLKLEDIPERLECFDISHIQGTDTVASMVVFTNGKPDKKEYRHFKTHQGNNDFASMREVTFRRYSDALAHKPGFEKLPDLIIIDGGRGQLSSALETVRDQLGIKIPMIALAEKLEEIYLPDQPIPIMLPLSDPGIQILQAIRDEAHRFAITFHRSLRNKHSLVSSLDNIPSVGKVRKQALMRAFTTVSRLKEASLEEIEAVSGMTKQSALAVYEYFHKNAQQ